MAIDEFGREIPGPSQGAAPSSRFRSRSRSPPSSYHHLDNVPSRYNHPHNNNNNNNNLHPNRHHSSPSRDSYHGNNYNSSTPQSSCSSRRGGGANHRSIARRSRSPSNTPSCSQQQQQQQQNQQRSRQREYDDHYSRGSSRNRSDSYHRSPSPSTSGGNSNRSGGGGGKSSSVHPSEAYVEEPLLCEALWKRFVERQKEEKEMEDLYGRDTNKNKDDDNDDDDKDEEMTQANPNDATDTQPTVDPMKREEKDEIGTKEEDGDTSSDKYNEYVSKYCMDYMRSFFNVHIDDEWFRLNYSPLMQKKFVLMQRDRARSECRSIFEQVEKHGKDDFIQHAKLGIGVKTASSAKRSVVLGGAGATKRKSSEEEEKDDGKESSECNPIPTSHLLSSQMTTLTTPDNPNTTPIIKITDVPPYVTDAQLSSALEDHSPNGPPLRIISTFAGIPPSIGTASSTTTAAAVHKPLKSLTRTAWAIFPTHEALEKLITHLTKANLKSHRGTKSPKTSHIVKNRIMSILELDVECSDPFNRVEIDHDGNGGAPPSIKPSEPDSNSNHNNNTNKKEKDIIPKIPMRKATVFLHPYPPSALNGNNASSSSPKKTVDLTTAIPKQSKKQFIPKKDLDTHNDSALLRNTQSSDIPQVMVLSASISSSKRINRDKTAALMIARALDAFCKMSPGLSLDDLLSDLNLEEDDENEFLHHNEEGGWSNDERVLDVAIAYLRRVHLFSFYNADANYNVNCEGNVLKGGMGSQSGVIYLRLKNADDILKTQPPSETNSEQDESRDLLVKRLDESISAALSNATSKLSDAVIVSEEVDQLADKLEKEEEKAKAEWIEAHSMCDADGRARCSFHFCRKLFKDKFFLHKHLLKKHPEYLHAETAKCADPYMMKAWEETPNRPLYPILVDCGYQFGFREVPVEGICPIARDPEPELYRAEEERRKKEEERRRQYEEKQQQHYHRYNNTGVGGDEMQTQQQLRIQQKQDFVDVDDMKEEKVELKFQNVEFPTVTEGSAKKKKKKRKKF